MMIYSYIEERYCPIYKQNVGIEYTQMSDGNVVKRCLSRLCRAEEPGEQARLAQGCLFHTFD